MHPCIVSKPHAQYYARDAPLLAYVVNGYLLLTYVMVYCNIRVSMVKDDQQMSPVCHPGNDSRLQRIPGNRAVERHVTDRLRDNVRVAECDLA